MPDRWIRTAGIGQSIFIMTRDGWYDLFTNRPMAPVLDSLSESEKIRIAKVHADYEAVFKKSETPVSKEDWTPEELELLKEREARRAAKRAARLAEEEAMQESKPAPYVANFTLVP